MDNREKEVTRFHRWSVWTSEDAILPFLYNIVDNVLDYVREGVHVSYVLKFARFVLKEDPSMYTKGYDSSSEHD